jgi:hypothetical protein
LGAGSHTFDAAAINVRKRKRSQRPAKDERADEHGDD